MIRPADPWRAAGAVGRFVIEKNVTIYAERLRTESDPEIRDLLRRLLVDEEDKFGRRSERLELVGRHIDDCRARLDQLREIQAQQDGAFPSADVAAGLMANVTRLMEILEQYRALLRRQADDGGY